MACRSNAPRRHYGIPMVLEQFWNRNTARTTQSHFPAEGRNGRLGRSSSGAAMAEHTSDEVLLHLYDLSSGLATQLSLALLGKQLEGIWHTGIVYQGVEYFYGSGIQNAPAGATRFGKPVRVMSLGRTQVPSDVFKEYMTDLQLTWTAEVYSLFENNCNHFCDEVASFLTGSHIPSYIRELPQDVLSTPFGQMIAPGLRNMQGTLNNTRPASPVQPTPFSVPQDDVTAAVTESLRAATAAVVADTGIPLDTDSRRRLTPQHKEDSIKKLAEANVALADNPHAAAEVASGLHRGSIGREYREQLGSSLASTMGFPAPTSRRLTTARSGEIITRLGSGQLLPLQSAPRIRLDPPAFHGSETRRLLSTPRDEPQEPKEGTRAPPGPSSAKIAGLNAAVAYTIERCNSGRTAAAKASFASAVRKEFAKIMAEGGCSPNEAALQAVRRAAAITPSAA